MKLFIDKEYGLLFLCSQCSVRMECYHKAKQINQQKKMYNELWHVTDYGNNASYLIKGFLKLNTMFDFCCGL